jgi:hypothetical protein
VTENPVLSDVSKLILNSAFYISFHVSSVVSKGLYPQIMSDVQIILLTRVDTGYFNIMPVKLLTFAPVLSLL